jgi:MFS family permease
MRSFRAVLPFRRCRPDLPDGWHRLLGLFAGADTIAAALVIGAFLLGFGVGSLAAGLYADRLSRRAALIAFALCEVGIALFAVLSPWLYYDVIYRGLLPLASSRGVIFGVVFAGLLWPTFLMGCSLPSSQRQLCTRSRAQRS